MISSLMALSVRARWMVLFFFLAVAGIGIWQLTKLPIDAVPDITTKQVQAAQGCRRASGRHRSADRAGDDRPGRDRHVHDRFRQA